MTYPLSSYLAAVVCELDEQREWLHRSERAEVEGRVTDRAWWLETLERRRRRVADLERLRDELVAAEESEAELAESHDEGGGL